MNSRCFWSAPSEEGVSGNGSLSHLRRAHQCRSEPKRRTRQEITRGGSTEWVADKGAERGAQRLWSWSIYPRPQFGGKLICNWLHVGHQPLEANKMEPSLVANGGHQEQDAGAHNDTVANREG